MHIPWTICPKCGRVYGVGAGAPPPCSRCGHALSEAAAQRQWIWAALGLVAAIIVIALFAAR